MKYLAYISVTLFCFGYWICNFIFANGSIPWWNLRIAMFSVVFACSFSVCYILTTGLVKKIFLIGIVFCLGDIVDRYLFNINEFNYNDFLLYIFSIYYLTTHYARQDKRNT